MNAGTGGTVLPASGWCNSGITTQIAATANAGYTFASWTGSGAGAYTGANNPAAVTMNGPVTETAAFTPILPPIISRSPSLLNNAVTQGQNAGSQTIQIWNSGSTTLSYSIQTNVPWLSVSPLSGHQRRRNQHPLGDLQHCRPRHRHLQRHHHHHLHECLQLSTVHPSFLDRFTSNQQPNSTHDHNGVSVTERDGGIELQHDIRSIGRYDAVQLVAQQRQFATGPESEFKHRHYQRHADDSQHVQLYDSLYRSQQSVRGSGVQHHGHERGSPVFVGCYSQPIVRRECSNDAASGGGRQIPRGDSGDADGSACVLLFVPQLAG